jgi:hypothetical protein
VHQGTSKSAFESALTPATGATLDFSSISDPVASGDSLKITAQNGITKATYAITADPTNWSQGKIISYTPDGKFNLDTSFFTNNQHVSCNSYLFQSLYPLQINIINDGSFPCGGENSIYSPVLAWDVSSNSVVGDYTVWLSDPSTNLGEYFQVHFDGTNWSALSPISGSGTPDTTPPDTTPPSIADYTLNGSAQNASFNPNTSGPITIVINASEPVKFNRIYICPASVATCDNSSDVKYFYQTSNYNSSASKDWDGKDASKVVVPDGTYEIGVEITDEAGNKTTSILAPYTITIDSTMP